MKCSINLSLKNEYGVGFHNKTITTTSTKKNYDMDWKLERKMKSRKMKKRKMKNRKSVNCFVHSHIKKKKIACRINKMLLSLFKISTTTLHYYFLYTKNTKQQRITIISSILWQLHYIFSLRFSTSIWSSKYGLSSTWGPLEPCISLFHTPFQSSQHAKAFYKAP